MRLLRLALSAVAIFAIAAAGYADDPPIESAIDSHVDAKLAAEKIAPAVRADDHTLIRRLTLDLVGRIPTASETDEFVKSKDADKRAKLVDRLLASPAFDRYQAIQFDAMLNATTSDNGRAGSVREYLTRAMKDSTMTGHARSSLASGKYSARFVAVAVLFAGSSLYGPSRL